MAWTSIQYVTSGVTLLAFCAVVILSAYRSRLEANQKAIESAPPEKRAYVVQTVLERFHVDTRTLTKEQAYLLALAQIKARSRRYTINAILFGLFGLLAFLYLIIQSLAPSPPNLPNTAGLRLLDKDLEALSHRLAWERRSGDRNNIELAEVQKTLDTLKEDVGAFRTSQDVTASKGEGDLVRRAEYLLQHAKERPELDFSAALDDLRFSVRSSDIHLKAKGSFKERKNGQQIVTTNEFSGFSMSFEPLDPARLTVDYEIWGMYLDQASWGDGPAKRSNGVPALFEGPDSPGLRDFNGICQLKITLGGEWADLYDTRVCVLNSNNRTACETGKAILLTAEGATPGGGPSAPPFKCIGITMRLKREFQYSTDLKNEETLNLARPTCTP